MERSVVNPCQWSVAMGFNQGEVVSGETRTLYCSGQTSVDAEGTPQHGDDMASQLALAVDNLEAVLAAAGMTLANVVRLNIYTTDVERVFEHFGVLASRTALAGVAPPGSLLGVAQLAYPDLLVELEATAVA